MTRQGNPYHNALAESFLKTLKYEEIYRQECRDLADAQASIERFLEKVYTRSVCICCWDTGRQRNLSGPCRCRRRAGSGERGDKY